MNCHAQPWKLLMAAFFLFLASRVKAQNSLDKGLLEPSWFGPGVEFRQADDIDYLWVRGDLSLRNRRLEIASWEEPLLLGNRGRSSRDQEQAAQLTPKIPTLLRTTLSHELRGYLQVVPVGEPGDLVVYGRIVDCDRGSDAAKWLVGFGAGASSATFDLKFIDRASGELLAALHHRSVSGSRYSDIEEKLSDWFEELAEAIRDNLGEVYRDAKLPKH